MEAIADFGFGKKDDEPQELLDREGEPLRPFDVESMMKMLSRNKIGVFEAKTPFSNEIQWGTDYGALKLEVNNRMQFLVHKLGRDLEGNPCWVTKKSFQLNRRGFGGYEEGVAQEIYQQIKNLSEGGLEGPTSEFEHFHKIAEYVADRLERTAKEIFIYRGIKKINDWNYQVVFELRGQGVQAPNQKKVEQNVTDISYDQGGGTIRIRNYDVQSKVGRERSWSVQPCHLDCHFFPTQDRIEIAEPVTILMKYF